MFAYVGRNQNLKDLKDQHQNINDFSVKWSCLRINKPAFPPCLLSTEGRVVGLKIVLGELKPQGPKGPKYQSTEAPSQDLLCNKISKTSTQRPGGALHCTTKSLGKKWVFGRPVWGEPQNSPVNYLVSHNRSLGYELMRARKRGSLRNKILKSARQEGRIKVPTTLVLTDL